MDLLCLPLLFTLLCAPLTSLAQCAQAEPAVQPACDVLKRTVGPEATKMFDLRLNASMPQGFELRSSGTGSVIITASALPELTYGAGYYLRHYCHMSFAWVRAGGNQVRSCTSSSLGALPPAVNGTVSIRKRRRWTYYQNVVTTSYSMWWWDWARWEREIDWMLLWGVNIALAYGGQEQVFRQVYNSIGVNDSILAKTFDGPAFLAWSRGQGSFGVGGPIPEAFYVSQHVLNKNITTRLRQLGVVPILPGFQGNVPKEMGKLFPGHNASNGWLDALDPLFDTIARKVGTQMQDDFGPSDYIEADGWFSLETGPWMLQEQQYLKDSQDKVENGCLQNFQIPSEAEAFARARAVYSSLEAARPGVTWVYQGYPWFRVHSAGPSCNQTALRHFIRGFLNAIPEDKLLVLDLIADYPNGGALWRYEGGFLRNATSIWCALNDWGGNVHMGGDLSYALSESHAAMATSGVDGVGLTPEGIDNSPAYFSLVLDSPWTTNHTTARQWLQEWGAGRCGNPGVTEAREAYDLLYQTVYRPGKPYLFCCSQPVFCPTTYPGNKPARPDYDTVKLRRALELMVEAAPACNTAAFRYDLVDVAREWLSMDPCLSRWDAINASAPIPQLRESTAALLELFSDVEALLATEEGFLLGSWLKSARAVSDWDGSGGSLADFYEWNARMQITTWAGNYARKEWSGMVQGYYSVQVELWLNNTIAQRGSKPPPSLDAELAEFADKWQHTRWSETSMPSRPVSDPVKVVSMLLKKYDEGALSHREVVI